MRKKTIIVLIALLIVLCFASPVLFNSRRESVPAKGEASAPAPRPALEAMQEQLERVLAQNRATEKLLKDVMTKRQADIFQTQEEAEAIKQKNLAEIAEAVAKKIQPLQPLPTIPEEVVKLEAMQVTKVSSQLALALRTDLGLGELPQFPDPPPRPTTFFKLPETVIHLSKPDTTLGAVSKRLEAALEAAGFTETSYYRYRDGFVLVARMEQIDAAARSLPPPDRWSPTPPPMRQFDLIKYLQSLFSARPGRYRLITFLVATPGFRFGTQALTGADANTLLAAGAASLPHAVSTTLVGEGSECYALIYEFIKEGMATDARLSVSPLVNAREHLEFAGIYNALKQ